MKAVMAVLILGAFFLGISPGTGRSSLSAAGTPSPQFRLGADTYAELGKAPEKAAARPNPLENDPQAVAAGKLLFLDHCAECHGDDARGGRKGPSLRAPDVRNATPGTLFWLLTNGVMRRRCPPGPSYPSRSDGSWCAS